MQVGGAYNDPLYEQRSDAVTANNFSYFKFKVLYAWLLKLYL